MKRSKVMYGIFLGPAILSFLGVYIYPTIRTAIMSFFFAQNVITPASEWKFVGINNYLDQFQSTLFLMGLTNIFKIWLWGGLITLLTAIILAVFLTSGVLFKSFWRAVLYLPCIVSSVAMSTMWLQYAFNDKYGLLKTIFSALGLKGMAEFQWIAPQHELMAMTIAYSFSSIGYFMLIIMSGIEKIPSDFYEAATIEGTNVFQKFFKITLPLMKTEIKSCIIFWSINATTFFVWSECFSPQVPATGTVTPVVVMYYTVFGQDRLQALNPQLLNAGAGASIGIILTFIVLIMFTVVNLFFKKENYEY